MFPIVLRADADAIARLRALREKRKFDDLPGVDVDAESFRCTALVNDLLDRLIQGVAANSRKSWVLEQFVPTLEAAVLEDSEARERFGPYLEQVMNALGIETSDGLLNLYLAFGGRPDS